MPPRVKKSTPTSKKNGPSPIPRPKRGIAEPEVADPVLQKVTPGPESATDTDVPLNPVGENNEEVSKQEEEMDDAEYEDPEELEDPKSDMDGKVPEEGKISSDGINEGITADRNIGAGDSGIADADANEGDDADGGDTVAAEVDGDGDGVVDEGDDESGSGADEEENDDEEEEDESLFLHAPLSDKKKDKDFEIFIGGLDKNAVEDDLINVFGAYGEIQSVRIVKHPKTQKSKGFAFIRYTTVEVAKKVLAELKDGIQVKDKLVGLSASQDNDTLYVGNICKTWTKDDVIKALNDYGIEQIDELSLPDDPVNEGKIKGHAFIEFCTHADAMTAFQRLRKPDAVFGCNRSAKVAFAPSSIHPNEDILSQVKTVFIECLPESWDEEKVLEHCKQYGEVEKVQLSRNFSNSRRKDFGFVSFTSRESAVACVEGINTAQLGEGEVKIKANIAKPQNKGRLAKQGARGGFKVVVKDAENTDAGGSTKKGKAKSKQIVNADKGQRKKSKSAKVGKSRVQGLFKGGQGGSSVQYHQKGEKPFKNGKRTARFKDNPPNPSKRARNSYNVDNMHGRPSGNLKSPQVGRSKKNFNKRPAMYRNPYPPAYAAGTSNYPGSGYASAMHSGRDMAPHAGYVEPSGKQARGAYGYGPVSGYDAQGRTSAPSGYVGGAVSSSQVPSYSGYAGYEAGYGYHQNSGTYRTPTNAAYRPAANRAYPPPGAYY